jgi:hypothetical protein
MVFYTLPAESLCFINLNIAQNVPQNFKITVKVFG